jgi:hypothetical protein
MENVEPESKKKIYYTGISVVYLSTRLQPRSLVASSKPLPAPFVLFDPQRDGIAYFAMDADSRRDELQGSDWRGCR